MWPDLSNRLFGNRELFLNLIVIVIVRLLKLKKSFTELKRILKKIFESN